MCSALTWPWLTCKYTAAYLTNVLSALGASIDPLLLSVRRYVDMPAEAYALMLDASVAMCLTLV